MENNEIMEMIADKIKDVALDIVKKMSQEEFKNFLKDVYNSRKEDMVVFMNDNSNGNITVEDVKNAGLLEDCCKEYFDGITPADAYEKYVSGLESDTQKQIIENMISESGTSVADIAEDMDELEDCRDRWYENADRYDLADFAKKMIDDQF